MLDRAARLQRRDRLRDRDRRRGGGRRCGRRSSTRAADAGLVECGFDAVDSLRIEAGHILFTRELASTDHAVRARVRATRGFRSARVLRRAGVARTAPAGAGAPPGGPPAGGRMPRPELGVPGCLEDGSAVMTSACWSPLLERRIGIGFVAAAMPTPAPWFGWCERRARPRRAIAVLRSRPRCFRAARRDAGAVQSRRTRRIDSTCANHQRSHAAMKRTPLYDQHVRDASAVINLKGFARAMQYVGHVRRASRDTRERQPVRRVAHGRARLQGTGRAGARPETHHERCRRSSPSTRRCIPRCATSAASCSTTSSVSGWRPIISSGSSMSPRPTTTISGC